MGFRDLAEEFKKQGLIILGVSKDSVQSYQKSKEKNTLKFALLSAGSEDPEPLWRLEEEKRARYGRTFMGTERTTFLIDEKGIVRKTCRKVKAKAHAKVCLQDFSNLEP